MESQDSEVEFLTPGSQVRKVRLGKAKDLSELGIRVENFSIYKSVLPHIPESCQ